MPERIDRRRISSVIGVARAVRSARALDLRWSVNSGCARRLAYQSRRPGRPVIEAIVEIVKPDFDSARPSSLPAGGRDVDDPAVFQRLSNAVIHVPGRVRCRGEPSGAWGCSLGRSQTRGARGSEQTGVHARKEKRITRSADNLDIEHGRLQRAPHPQPHWQVHLDAAGGRDVSQVKDILPPKTLQKIAHLGLSCGIIAAQKDGVIGASDWLGPTIR